MHWKDWLNWKFTGSGHIFRIYFIKKAFDAEKKYQIIKEFFIQNLESSTFLKILL